MERRMKLSKLRYFFATRTKRYLSSLGKGALIRENNNYLSKYHELYLKGEFNLENKKHFLEGWFYESVGYFPNIEKPRTFNEKIQWYKLYYNDPVIAKCIDKITFKDFIKETVGDEYVVPSLGVYSSADEINFDELPDRFVIKANFGSSGKEIIIVTDKSKLDIASARKTISSWVKPWWRDSWGGYEFVRPRILIEEYIEQKDGQVYDYKFWCFNGEPKYVYVSINRFKNHAIDIFNTNWEKQDLTFSDIPNSGIQIEKPRNLPQMIELSRRISRQFPFVRVDFYELRNRIYIGELTFYPNGGFEVFIPPKWDKELGKMLILPRTKLDRGKG
jgi:hypothetical protein